MPRPPSDEISVFDAAWVARATAEAPRDSWASEATSPNSSGGIYLDTLRRWFDQFPTADKDKQHLRAELESFANPHHVGAVNELSWWRLMCDVGFRVEPVPTSNQPRPDFKVSGPNNSFVEVTTLNLSKKEQAALASGCGVAINHSDVFERLVTKAASDKADQMLYAAAEGWPCWLIIFDYTEWSAFATARVDVFAASLLGEKDMFRELPADLSGLVYVERKVFPDGRIGISLLRSAAYCNPHATRPTPDLRFGALRHLPPLQSRTITADWIWLE